MSVTLNNYWPFFVDLIFSKLFDRKQCRSCGGRVTFKRICLDCKEPSAIWCEGCFKLEEYTHSGHVELDLF